MVKIESGRDKGKEVITMDSEPKGKRPGPEPINTHNVSPLTWAVARAARAGARAKIEAEKKAAQNEKP
jgi:hypothetical protein